MWHIQVSLVFLLQLTKMKYSDSKATITSLNWIPYRAAKWCESINSSSPFLNPLYRKIFQYKSDQCLMDQLALHNNRPNSYHFTHLLCWLGPSTWKTLPLLFAWLKSIKSVCSLSIFLQGNCSWLLLVFKLDTPATCSNKHCSIFLNIIHSLSPRVVASVKAELAFIYLDIVSLSSGTQGTL